jgi:hypothetical protein
MSTEHWWTDTNREAKVLVEKFVSVPLGLSQSNMGWPHFGTKVAETLTF